MYKYLAGILDAIRVMGVIFLFAWISFFAPVIGERYEFLFLFATVVFLLILFIFDRNRLFNKEDAFFWIFLLAIMAGLVNVKDVSTAYRHFWVYVFPMPFLYLYAKLSFREKYGALILRCICIMAGAVAIDGFIELFSSKNFAYLKYMDNLYYKSYIGIRMMSTHIHPAPLGTYLVAIFPLTLALYMMEKARFLKAVSIVCAISIFTAIIFTFSRGAFIGLFIEMLIIAVFSIKKKKIFYIYILLFPILLFIIGSLFEVFDIYKYCRFGYKDLGRWFIYSRKIDALMGAARMLKDHPFFGVGFGHYRVLFDNYFPLSIVKETIYDQKVADCMYVTILAETGIIGFGGFIFFIINAFKNAWKALKVRLTSDEGLLLLGFFAGFCGMMATFLTYDGLYWTAPAYMFWAYAGILASFIAEKRA